MAITHVEPESREPIDPEFVAAFRDQVGGNVLLPSDDAYNAARRVWNGMIDKRPALIVRPRGASDVQRAVVFAREHDLSLSIKGGGHNVAGHAVSDGGLMIDLGAMRAVWVDPVARVARVQGGALWADFDRETAPFGLATTGGLISTTGVGGLTLGGGVGWLVGKHGISIDNLRSVDLVTADGEQVRASATEQPDLFWAVRGGGGNFGVATSLEFALHRQGDVLAGYVVFSIDQARDVLLFYREFVATCPDDLTVYCALVPDAESGQRVIALVPCWPGDLAEGERLLAPLRSFGTPLVDVIEPMPYAVWQGAFDADLPHGQRYYWKGSLVRELTDDVIAQLVRLASYPPLPLSRVVIECYAGAMNRVDPTATAFPHRDARYQLVIASASADAADDETSITWARGLYTTIEPQSLNGAFLNFNAVNGADRHNRVRAGYGVNWDRLVAIKRRYDPTNLFRENNNIVP